MPGLMDLLQGVFAPQKAGDVVGMQPQSNGGGLLDHFRVNSTQQQMPQQAQPQGLAGSDKFDFRDFLGNIAPAVAMLDPRNQQLGMGLMAMNADRREKAERRQNQNQTVAWLQRQGLGPEESAVLAGDRDGLRAWLKESRAGNQPDWQISTVFDDQGREQRAMIDKRTGRFNILGGAKSNVPEGAQTLQWRANAAGLQPGTKAYSDFMVSGGKGPLVNVNTGENTNEFVKKSDDAAATRMNDIVTAGQSAPQTMADMQQLVDLGKSIGTGPGAQLKGVLGPYAQSVGLNIDGLSDIQAYNAITSRLAPQMRAVGSGSSSDRDVSLFFQSLPNLRNTQGGNEIIANTMKAVAQNKINAADLARKAQRGDISWQDADKQISELPNPYDLFKQFQKAPAPAGAGNGGTTSGGLKWSIVP